MVSTTASLAAKWLVPRVAAFQDAHPGVEVRITTSSHLVVHADAVVLLDLSSHLNDRRKIFARREDLDDQRRMNVE